MDEQEEMNKTSLKEAEPEPEPDLDRGPADCTAHANHVEEQNVDFQLKSPKKEEPDDDYICGFIDDSGQFQKTYLTNEATNDNHLRRGALCMLVIFLLRIHKMIYMLELWELFFINYVYCFLLVCEHCRPFYFNKCKARSSALFISDAPVAMGVDDRARQTLPPDLEVRQSDIPNAGLGVFNTGKPVPVGTHFGPYQGELVEQEEAMNSDYSWVIDKKEQGEEYIDGRRETHSNWMRYVNYARNDEEQNLVAIQYRGGIFYRCCRPIAPGQELLVSCAVDRYDGVTFDSLWNPKCFTNGLNSTQSPVITFSSCPSTSSPYKHVELGEDARDDLTTNNQKMRRDTDDSHTEMHKKVHPCLFCGKTDDGLVSHKKHLIMRKSKELSQDLRNLIVAKHNNGIGYRKISKLLNVPVSTVGAIIRKWKKHHFTMNRPRTGAPRKISDKGVERIISSVVQEPMTTCGELQKDLELAGTIVSKKTISNALNRHGLYTHSPRKTPLLKKKHVGARLKFAAQHLDKPVEYWENIAWSDETKIELFGSHNTHGSNDSAHQPKNTIPTVKLGGGNIMAGAVFQHMVLANFK